MSTDQKVPFSEALMPSKSFSDILPTPPASPSPFTPDHSLSDHIRHKCDLHILPPLALLFIITFLDRTNIANAKIEGMTQELHMTGSDYNKTLWILISPLYFVRVAE